MNENTGRKKETLKKGAKKLSTKVIIWEIAASVCFIALGIFLIAKPSTAIETICYILGAAALIAGIVRIIMYIMDKAVFGGWSMTLVGGVVLSVLGIILLIHPQKVINLLPVVFGVFVILDSLFKLQTAVNAHRLSLPGWWSILVFSIVLLIFGLILVFRPSFAVNTFVVIIGIAVLLSGLENLLTSIFGVVIYKKSKPVDTSYTVVGDEKTENKRNDDGGYDVVADEFSEKTENESDGDNK